MQDQFIIAMFRNTRVHHLLSYQIFYLSEIICKVDSIIKTV